MTPILMTEEYWANTQLSIARYCGSIKFNGHTYTIVDKHGRDLFQCSMIAEKEGGEKAIEPGEPADLCREDFIPIYKKLGRDGFIKFIKEHPNIDSVKEARKIIKEVEQEKKDSKKEKSENLVLF